MNDFQEKEVIYQLMSDIMQEKKELNQQFNLLKKKLEKLDFATGDTSTIAIAPELSLLKKERIKQQDAYNQQNKSNHYISFDRIARTIASILKQSEVPLSNKQLFKRIHAEYEITISYTNLTNNVLRRINESTSIPVERAHRGYWQYRLKN
ncbi:hypothetical protein [Enterococcus termitis]|uniref:Uncharacterized protein n=1 Tax=Enterococcus termitis TaxID=332950 RepID=A0A1E5H0D8_9ENTE|nr:hypothetical protein [Enterococcus termitis]OEG18437.1 hypothetical protein BCR25_16570 [Enterococcus termitis]OJG96583.1 hypothetical protein RV18_GL002089 [Enterococcus termitis]